MANSDIDGWIKSRLLHPNVAFLAPSANCLLRFARNSLRESARHSGCNRCRIAWLNPTVDRGRDAGRAPYSTAFRAKRNKECGRGARVAFAAIRLRADRSRQAIAAGANPFHRLRAIASNDQARVRSLANAAPQRPAIVRRSCRRCRARLCCVGPLARPLRHSHRRRSPPSGALPPPMPGFRIRRSPWLLASRPVARAASHRLSPVKSNSS